MIGWQVLISDSAKKDYYSADITYQKKFSLAFKALKENPYKKRNKADIKKLKGSYNPAFYRIRVGKYRIIYTIINKDVKITRIFLRKKAH